MPPQCDLVHDFEDGLRSTKNGKTHENVVVVAALQINTLRTRRRSEAVLQGPDAVSTENGLARYISLWIPVGYTHDARAHFS